MGRPKQLLLVDGHPMLAVVVAQAFASSLDEVVVVLGANADEVRAGVDLNGARVVVNDAHAEGMSTSLHAGLGALAESVDRAVVLLADRPDVTAALVDSLLDLHTRSGRRAAAVSVDGVLQPPVVLSRALWTAAARLRGDVGLRNLLRARVEDVAALPVGAAIDVDTPEDYARLLRSPC